MNNNKIVMILLGVWFILSCSKDDDNQNNVPVGVTQQTEEGSEFITTWDAKEITIPINPDFTYNYDVDWDNDGTIDQTGITGEVTHTFATSGKHTIRISGGFPAIQFSYEADDDERLKIVSLDQWGAGEWKSMKEAFKYCENLKIPATDKPDLTNVTDMRDMFYHAYSANPNVSNWDLSNVTNISNMFYHANAAKPDVSAWNVSNVTDMSGVFWDTFNANPDVSAWNVSNVIDMKLMFSGTLIADPDVSKWNVSNVTDMSAMFSNTSIANPDVSKWDVSNVIDMKFMFLGAFMATPDIVNWDIPKVTDMAGMFDGALRTFKTAYYELLLINFANQPHQENVSFDAGSAIAISGEALTAKQNLINDGWTIIDGST